MGPLEEELEVKLSPEVRKEEKVFLFSLKGKKQTRIIMKIRKNE